MNGLHSVSADLTLDEYREVAEFRHRIRAFERGSEQSAAAAGTKAECFLLLLAIQGLPEGSRPTIPALAARLCLSAEATSLLVDEAAGQMDLLRSSDQGDGTEGWVKLTKTGREKLRRIALADREDLEHCGPELLSALQIVIRQRRKRGRRAG